MSNYYGYWCPKCYEGTGHGLNHGERELTWLLEHWGPIHKVMMEIELATSYIFSPYGMYKGHGAFDVNPIGFLIEHFEHGVVVESEYDTKNRGERGLDN